MQQKASVLVLTLLLTLSSPWQLKECAAQSISASKDPTSAVAQENHSIIDSYPKSLSNTTNGGSISVWAGVSRPTSNQGDKPGLPLNPSVPTARSEDAAYARYLTLAFSELESDLDQAIKDCRKAISLYNGVPTPPSAWTGYGPTAPLNPARIASALMGRGRTEEASKLMEDAAIQVQKENGLSGRETKEEFKALFEFYFGFKEYDNALRSIDRLLACKMLVEQHFAVYSHGDNGFSLASIFDRGKSIAKDNPKLAYTIFSKILDAQQNQLPSDDRQIERTYLALAEMHAIVGENANSLVEYQHALHIIKLYVGDKSAVRQMPDGYIKALRIAGNDVEADRLEVLRTEPSNERQMRPNSVGSVAKADLSTLRSEYERAKQEAPYSNETRALLTRLYATSMAQHASSSSIFCAEQQLVMAERFQEKPWIAKYTTDLIGLNLRARNIRGAEAWLDKLIQRGDVNPRELSRQRDRIIDSCIELGKLAEAEDYLKSAWTATGADGSTLYLAEKNLIEALKKKGRKSEAEQETVRLFEHHSSWISKVNSSEVAIDCAKLAIEANQSKWLPELLTKGESLAKSDRDRFLLIDFATAWSTIGNNDHAKALNDEYQKLISQQSASFKIHSSLPDLDGKAFTDQTSIREKFSPPVVTNSYAFNFAALSSKSLTFKDNARLAVEKPNEVTFAGTYGKLQIAGIANHAGKLSFTHKKVLDTKASRGQVGLNQQVTDDSMKLPILPALPFKPALTAAPGFHNSFPGSFGMEAEIGLGSGDYQTSADLDVRALNVEGAGRVRVFIATSNKDTDVVFHLPAHGLFNAEVPAGVAKKDSIIELWYDGVGILKLDEDSTFNGIIYAPNAKIEIGPGRAVFCGAMVAKEILVTGDSKIYWDPSLSNWEEDLVLH
jgi:tetratricopeptide (TPR) repeat protein